MVALFFRQDSKITCKAHGIFQLLNDVENNGTTRIMHHGGEHPLLKSGDMHGRKLPAATETVRINAALVLFQKMTGDGIDEHIAGKTFLQV